MRHSPRELFSYTSSELRIEEWHNAALVWNFVERYDNKFEFFIDVMRYHNDGLRFTITPPEIENKPSIIYTITVINTDISKTINRKFSRNSLTTTSEDFIINTPLNEKNGFVYKDVLRFRIRFTGFSSSLTPKRESVSNPVSPVRPPTRQKSPVPIPLSQQPLLKLDVSHESDSLSETTSEEEKAFAGLYNQGATCYLNSIIQVLFHIPVFRGLVFAADTNNTMINALQRLFAAMQASVEPQRTVELTKSFGWSSSQIAIQHDAHEFLLVFLDILKKPLGPRLFQLFEGTQVSFIRCRDVPKCSETSESFLVLSLDINKNLESSLENYTARQRLSDSNTYDAGSLGPQEAEVGIDFVSLPPILLMHLKRFAFGEGGKVKIYDRFEYPTEIDMSKYVNVNAIEKDMFRLHAVIIHSGGPDKGHYYSYISINKKFYRFNDSDVKPALADDVFENSFGGEMRSHCAYLLVYIRESVEEGLFAPLPDSQIPENVRYVPQTTRVKSDPDTVPISIVTNDSLSNCASRGLLSYIHPQIIIEVPRNGNMQNVYEIAMEKLQMPKIRLFGLVQEFYVSTEIDPTSKSPINTIFRFKALYSTDIEGNFFVPVFMYEPSLPDPLRFLHVVSTTPKKSFESLFDEASQKLGYKGGSFKVWAATNKSDANFINNPRESFKLNALMCGTIVVLKSDGWTPRVSNRLRMPLFSKSDTERLSYFSKYKKRYPSDFARFIRFRYQCEHINLFAAGGRKQISYFPPLINSRKAYEFISMALGLDFDSRTDTMLLFAGQSQHPLSLDDDSHLLEELSIARSRNVFAIVQKNIVAIKQNIVRLMIRVTFKAETIMGEFPLLVDESQTVKDVLDIAVSRNWVPNGHRVLMLREPESGVLTVVNECDKVSSIGVSARIDVCPRGMPMRSERDDYVTVIVARPVSDGSKTPMRRQLAVVDLHEKVSHSRVQIEASIGRSIRGLKIKVASAKRPEFRKEVGDDECLCDLIDPLFHYIVVETASDELSIQSI